MLGGHRNCKLFGHHYTYGYAEQTRRPERRSPENDLECVPQRGDEAMPVSDLQLRRPAANGSYEPQSPVGVFLKSHSLLDLAERNRKQ